MSLSVKLSHAHGPEDERPFIVFGKDAPQKELLDIRKPDRAFSLKVHFVGWDRAHVADGGMVPVDGRKFLPVSILIDAHAHARKPVLPLRKNIAAVPHSA